VRNQFQIKNWLRQTPLAFLLIAVFHVCVAVYSLWLYHDFSFSFYDWQFPLLTCLYAVFWLFVSLMKKWAAYSYILLTCLGLLLHFLVLPYMKVTPVEIPLFPADIIFSGIILIYFKRFE
jgi:hypothetical protein